MPRSSRRHSRIAAFRALFEADLGDKDPRPTLERQLPEAGLSEDAAAFARRLVEGVVTHRAAIDAEISLRAPAFPLVEMAPVDRNVLRLAIYELLFDNRAAPWRVVINEAVDLAKGYGSESSGRFVNGVLGAVALAAASGEGQQQS